MKTRFTPSMWTMKTLFVAMIVSLALAATALAQSGAGTIQGTVQDASSAALPGAKIRVVNTATGVELEATANSAGFFAAQGLFAGTYRMSVSFPGMKTHESTITLQNAQVLVFNPQLSVGDISEKVTVTGETLQLVTYDSGTVSTNLDSSRIDQLPQNGRNVLNLAAKTVPGLEANGTRANGLMGEAMEYSLDGAPQTNRNFGSPANSAQAILPDPDSVQEAKFETLNSSAQFATPATVILTTKSGTNEFHGSMFHTIRNNYFGIAKARQNPPDFAAPPLNRNEFGFSIGGPILIPKVYDGRNRSFFFYAYERFSLRQKANQLVRVPTVAMRGGDFSGLINSAGVLQQLYDPNTTQSAANNFSRLPFSNNQIPINRISPLAKTLYAATPLPNRPDNPLVNANLIDINNTMQTVPNYSTRFDHVFNEKNRGFFRFTEIDQEQQALRNYPSASPANIEGGGLPAGATGYQRIPIQTISGSLGYSKVISPTFFSETILSMQWQRMYVEGNQASQQNYEQQLGLPNNFGQIGFPAIGSNLIMPYGGSQWNYGMSQRITTVDENLNLLWGKHQFAFGGRYRHEKFGYMSDRSPDQIAYTNQASGIYDPATGANYGVRANTGYADADFFLGAASSFSQNLNAPFNNCRLAEYDFYFQDNWRLGQRVTINLGLRYEGHPAPIAKQDYLVMFDMKNNALAFPQPIDYYIKEGLTTPALVTNLKNLGVKFNTLEQSGLPSRGFYNSYDNWLPRLGIAYTPSFGRNGTVIRAGYGEYVYPVPVRNSIRYLTAGYPFTAGYSRSYTSATQSPDGLPNSLVRTPLTVITGVNTSNVVDSNSVTALLPGIGTGTKLNPEYPPARVRTANFTVEQPFKDGSALRATYVYSYGYNLDQNYNFNDAPSAYTWFMQTGLPLPTGRFASTATRPYDKTTWGGATMSMKSGWSTNSALQVNFQRPFRKGYAYQLFWVYSRAFRVGGNTFRDNILYPAAIYAPGVLPAGMPTGDILNPSRELSRYQNYKIDNAIPTHRITYNGIVDIPVGKGKKYLSGANRLVDALLGGYQVAFTGTVVTQAFAVNAANWGATSELKRFKNEIPIQDCRSGVCRDGYLWFNGYIAPNLVNASSRGVTGLPADYVPYSAPINNTPGAANFGNNNVTVRLQNGTSVLTGYSPGPAGAHPFGMQFLEGPINFSTDMSLYKIFSITERVKFRFNIDAFNAFNIQGMVNPDALTGIQTMQTSYWTPRQIQFTARLTY